MPERNLLCSGVGCITVNHAPFLFSLVYQEHLSRRYYETLMPYKPSYTCMTTPTLQCILRAITKQINSTLTMTDKHIIPRHINGLPWQYDMADFRRSTYLGENLLYNFCKN